MKLQTAANTILRLTQALLNRRFALAVACAALFIPSVYYGVRQVQEDQFARAYLEEHDLLNAPPTRETAVALSRAVRADFTVDESQFRGLDFSDRPFLREDLTFLLTHKEGLCGEGTRVLVNLLGYLDIDATRVVLFNEHLESSHTLVSAVVDDQEFLLDSINALPKINNILETQTIVPRDFHVLHYTDDFYERRELAAEDKAPYAPEVAAFFEKYWLYSYEAIPYAKLLTTLGIDVRVFSFQRPYRWISSLAEKPNLVMSIVWFGAGLFGCILLALTMRFGRRLLAVRPQAGAEMPRPHARTARV